MEFLDLFSNMTPSKLKSYAIIAAVAAVVLLYLGYHNMHMAQQMSRLVYSPINASLHGLVKVTGEAVALDVDEAFSGLSKEPALWYHYSIERYEDGDDEPDFTLVEEQHSHQPFIIKNIGSACLVDPRGLDYHASGVTLLTRTWHEDTKTPRNIPAWGTQEASRTIDTYRFVETIIQPKQSLHVVGEAGAVPAHMQKYTRDQQQAIHCLITASKDGKTPLYASNDTLNNINTLLSTTSKLQLGAGMLLLIVAVAAGLGFISKGGT